MFLLPYYTAVNLDPPSGSLCSSWPVARALVPIPRTSAEPGGPASSSPTLLSPWERNTGQWTQTLEQYSLPGKGTWGSEHKLWNSIVSLEKKHGVVNTNSGTVWFPWERTRLSLWKRNMGQWTQTLEQYGFPGKELGCLFGKETWGSEHKLWNSMVSLGKN